MGLFDDIPMVRGAGSRPGALDPAAGQLRFERAPPPEDDPTEEHDPPESPDPVQFAQARALPLPLPGIPGGVGVAPDIRDAWRKGALDGIMRAQRYFRLGAGAGGSRRNDDDCYERWEREDARCRQFRPWGGRNWSACKDRASARRDLCIRNGGRPSPDEPPEYDWRDFMN